MGEWMKGKILIVDDDPLILEFLGKKLSDAGYVTESCCDGAEALKKIYASDFSLIISDILMPNMDGYQLQQKLLDNPKTAKIPFIFLSVKSSPMEQLEGLRRGADDYLCKPPEVRDLLNTIDRVLARSQKLRQPEADFSGNAALMDLSDLIQLIGMDNKSGTLQFKSPMGETLGQLVFDKGALVYAKSNQLEGEEAFYEIFAVEDGFYEFYGRTAAVAPNISSKAMSILLDASRLLDESQRLGQFHIEADTVLELTVAKIPDETRKKWSQNRLQPIISLVRSRKSFEDILSSAPMSGLTVKAILAHLLREKIIRKKTEDDLDLAVSISPKILKELKRIQNELASGALEVKGLAHRASIFFQQGAIVHAFYGRTDSKKALFRILAESGNDISTSFNKRGISTETSIQEGVAELIQEGQTEISGLQRLNRTVFEKKVSVNYASLEKIEALKKNPGFKEILSLVQQYETFGEIVENSKQTDFEVCRQLLFLLKKNVLVFSRQTDRKIMIVTDSLADLPENILSSCRIKILECDILPKTGKSEVFSEKRVDTADDPNSSETSQESSSEMDAFIVAFKDISSKNDILAILSTENMSNAIRNAEKAKEIVLNASGSAGTGIEDASARPIIELIDSKSISSGLGLLVAEACEKISSDWQFKMLSQYLTSIIPMCQSFVIVEEISRLKNHWKFDWGISGPAVSKDGRGIFTFSNGCFRPMEKMLDVIDPKEAIIEKTFEYFGNYEPGIIASISFAGARDFALHLKDLLALNFTCKRVYVSSLGETARSIFGSNAVALSILPVIQNVSIALT
jgi:CheY-like chemotaxis protein/fatty acid-binding protein DegV